MANPFQTRTRLQIRESIGYALNDMALVTPTTATGLGTANIVDAYSFAPGGDDEYNGRQVICVTPTGDIVAGEKSWVDDFDGDTWDASLAPAFTSTTAVGDIFELWKVFTYEEVNNAINQAYMEATKDSFQVKQVTSQFTDEDEYEYNILSGFVGVNKVEYAYNIGIDTSLHRCETAWTAGSANVTVTADSAFKKEGSYSCKGVEDGGSGSGAILAYATIAADIDDCDKVEFWFYSSIALTAGQIEIHLDDTAAIASALETIDIPAMDAATWYRHSLSLANPHTDVDLISVGIYQVSDVGAFTFYVDDVRAVLSTSKDYRPLNPEHWRIIKGSTPLLKLTSEGLGLVGDARQLRISGYQLPTMLTADATESQIDPSWLINKVTGELMLNHSKSPRLDIVDRDKIAKSRLEKADKEKMGIRFNPATNTRWVF